MADVPRGTELLHQYRQAVWEFAEELLASYVDDLDDPLRRFRAKEVNDALWGTMHLSALEVAVLDSPLMQRLRRIRQLGVVHLVYPSANHSRLEHSLGTTHQADRLLNAVERALALQQGNLPPGTREMVRLAALVHDVGHGFMSHVSENALMQLDEAQDIVNAFKDTSPDRSFGEITSYLILTSPVWGRLLEVAMTRTDTAFRFEEWTGPKGAQEAVANLVVGKRISDSWPLLQELISGPFDADKLDYMPRDAFHCGVPTVTDVDRLIAKVRVATVTPDSLPPDLASKLPQQPTYNLIGIARSGNRTIDELTLGRILLFDKLYRHHKVRAAEAMISAAVRQMYTMVNEPVELLSLTLRVADEVVMDLEVDTLELVMPSLSGENERSVRLISHLVGSMRERRLFVRASAFAQKMPADPYQMDQEHSQGLERLLREGGDPQARYALADEIAEEAEEIIRHLGETQILDRFPDSTIEGLLVVDTPRPPTKMVATARALLVPGDGSVLKFSDDAPETPQWASAYTMTRDLGHVFAPMEVADHVYLATEMVLRREYGVRLPSRMQTFAGRHPADLAALRKRLAETAYYDEAPRDLLPKPERLTRADVPRRMRKVCTRLAGYEGPTADPEAKSSGGMREERVGNFVSQFPEDLIDNLLSSLESLSIVGRQAVTSTLERFLEGSEGFQSASLVPLGEPKDSSSIHTYFAIDLAERYGFKARALADALVTESKLIFVDDLIYSGMQASSIVDAWFGNLEGSEALDEDRVVLPGELQERLRQRDAAFVFAAGKPEGERRLIETCGAHGWDVKVEIGVAAGELPTLLSFDDNLIKECRRIGLQLVRNEDWALGYGNGALLVAFPHNTPTQSLTCLWASGMVDGRAWTPLLPRRRKS